MNRISLMVALIVVAAVVMLPLLRQERPDAIAEPVVVAAALATDTLVEASDTDRNSASVGTALEIVAVYPPGDGVPEDEIVFYFNERLAPFSAPADTDEPALAVTPHAPGQVTIENAWLRFSAPVLEGLFEDPQTTHIEVVLHENLRSISNQALPADMRRHIFVAPPPEIASMRLEEITAEKVTARLAFSRVADLSVLPELLTMTTAEGASVPVSVTPGDDHASALLSFPLTVEPPVTVRVDKGLRWGDGLHSIAQTMVAHFPERTGTLLQGAALNTDETPHLLLQFTENIPVRWIPLLATVKTGDPGELIPFTLAPEQQEVEAAQQVRLMLPETPEVAALDVVLVELSPWLRTHRSGMHPRQRIVTEAVSHTMQQNRRLAVALQYHYWEADIHDGLILRLNFYRGVTAEQLAEHIEIVPAVDWAFDDSDSRQRSLRLKGAFQSETEYTLRILAGVKDEDGNILEQQDRTYALQETPLREGAAFDATHLYYFPRRDMARPVLHARNIKEARVQLGQVFPSNLPIFVRDLTSRGMNRTLLAEYARETAETTVIFPDVPDTLLSASVDLDALLPSDGRGVFVMSVTPMYDYRNDSRLLIYTDLGALTHWSDDGLAIFVHNLFTLAPTPTARIRLYSEKYQEMGVTHTDAEGIARFMSFDPALGAPALAVIETKDDYTFVDLRSPQDSKTPFTASMPAYDRDGYDAFVYLDRELYRPGETIHIRWIARTRYVDAVADAPFQLRIANPQGRWIYEAPVTPSEFGTGSFSFRTEQAHPTGRYRVELRVPEARTPLGGATFNLEEFVPNRMRAETQFDRELLFPGDTASIAVTAENLFGGAAAGRKTEARIYLRPTTYESDAWPGYYFGNEDSIGEHLTPLGEAVTDENGAAAFSYTFEPPPEATMPLEAIVGVRVFEVGGRAVSDTDSARVFPHDILLGIAAAPRHEAEQLDVHLAAITSDDAAADLEAVQLTLEREEWNYHVRGFQHRRETRWEKAFHHVKTYDVLLSDGKGTLELPYPRHGKYRLRVHSPDTPMYSMLLFDRWWGRLDITSSDRPELIRLSVDKELYQAGDAMHLRIESPYDGKAFVVVQGEEILEQLVVPVEGGEGRASFIVPRAWFPNAWIQATVVRDTSQQEASQYPYSSFSMVNVPLDMPERRIEVSLLEAPEEIRPDEPFTVRLETRDIEGAPVRAEVTLAAVDEGIHGILGYDNPDPYNWFQRSRKFDVRRAHYYENVLFDSEPPPIGGDMMRRLGIASQVGENWIRPVALWSGVVQTDASGQAAITLDVPEFIGRLRLVAVAVTERATGATAEGVYVRRPYILRTGMPRFALPGDRFQCAAVITNMTDAPVTARLRWNASGTLSGGGEKKMELAANGETSWRIPVTAGSAPGQGAITWEAIITDADGVTLETLREEAPIPVGPPAAYQTETELMVLNPGETRLIENTHFMDEPSLHTAIQVSGMPVWRLYPGLRYLLRFPYGCVEQVTSQALPLYLLRNYTQLYQDLLPSEETVDAAVVDTYLQHAIEQLLLMQTRDGGLATWPGGVASYPYGSVYALHFLTLARRDYAYEVYDAAFEALQEYALEVMRNERRYSNSPSDYYLRAYACYVLALDGNLEAIEYVSRFEHVPMPLSARYLLAAIKATHTQEVVDIDRWVKARPGTEMDARELAGTLHSRYRADAVTLMALARMNAQPEKMHSLAERLFAYFDGAYAFTTQETAFVVTALGMYLEQFHHDDPELIAMRIVAPDDTHTRAGTDVFRQVLRGESPRYEISNTGALPLYVALEMSGLPLQPRMAPVEEELSVKREYFHQTGEPVTDNAFVHGGQYIVALTIAPERKVENLLIVDMLPAGFEIANPRLEPEIQPDVEEAEQDDTIVTPAHLEVRDDRIALALDKLENRAYTFRYLVRAVTPGTFQHPALHAECMYQPAIRAATVPAEITVE